MYERFYNLRERPFALSPDPEYLYLSRVHREALDYIRYGIESRAGFIIVTGEIGAGKTTLLQTLLQRLDERTVVARLVNTILEPRELLEAIMLDFGLDTTGKSKPVMLRDLGQFLVQQRAQGRRPLLVVDEAQNLSAQALEEVRLLSNLETEKSKLLQILLVGQPNLRDTIASAELEQFRQRVAVSYHLTPLDAPETTAYINSRLQHAAIGEPLRFPPDAAEVVHRLSGGVPRVINVICDATLVFGYAEERRIIDRALLEEVIAELQLTGVLPPTADARDTGRETRAATPVAAPIPAAAPHEVRAPAAAARVAAPALAAAAGAPADRLQPEPGRDTAAVALARDAELAQIRQQAAAREAELARERALVIQRQQELAAREAALAQRERQIAEQRRIMTEEYRLLRQGHAASRAASAPAGSGAARPYGGHRQAQPLMQAARPTNFWHRIFRLFAREPALRS